MKTLIFAAVLASLALGLMGCTYVTSGMPTTETVSGEAWYVKDTGFAMMTFATKVYYCPAPSGKGEATCTRAIMHKAGEGPAASSKSASTAEPASGGGEASGQTETPSGQ